MYSVREFDTVTVTFEGSKRSGLSLPVGRGGKGVGGFGS